VNPLHCKILSTPMLHTFKLQLQLQLTHSYFSVISPL